MLKLHFLLKRKGLSSRTLSKAVALALTGTIILICFAGCGSGKTTDSKANTAKKGKVSDSSIFSERDLEQTYDESVAEKVTLSGNEDVEITKEGVYVLSGTLEDASVVVNVGDSEKVQLVLSGVNITNENKAGILVANADKVFITTDKESKNVISTSGEFESYGDISNIDAAIFSKDDLTINGLGMLSITTGNGHGIVSKNDLRITGGVLNVTAAEHGLTGKDAVKIAAGTINVTAGEKGIKSKNSDETGKGLVYICGGEITISAGTEGIEGTKLYIKGGEIDITAKDDGLNASSNFDEDIELEISGGKLHVDAGGDGIDSNGSILVSGGEAYVSGSVSDGDSALDFETSATITGGTFVAAGMSGMAENFGSDSTQGAMLVNVSTRQENKEIAVKDSDGNTILSWTPDKSYNSVVISTPDIVKGNTYTVSLGSEKTTVTMENIIYGESTGNAPGGMGGMTPPDGNNKTPPNDNFRNGNDGTQGKPGNKDGTPPEKPDSET